MKILEILDQHRNDFRAMLECEHCKHQQKLTSGYDDAYYHNEVLPKGIFCQKCGKNRVGDTQEGTYPI